MKSVLKSVLMLALIGPASDAHSSVVEYLYIEANEGSSAGGHVALRLGDYVFDFQNAELGTLRARRTPWEHFAYLYAVRENRSIHIARIDVPDEARDKVLEHFNGRYLIEKTHFSIRDALLRDRALIDWLLAGAPGSNPSAPRERLGVRGAGLFQADSSAGDESFALAALRDRVATERGDDYVAERILEFERELQALAPAVGSPKPGIITPDEIPPTGYSFSGRYRELCEKIAALRLLQVAASLSPGKVVAPRAERYALDPSERARLRSFADAREERLAGLVASGRPDWGFALIVGMARLQLLRESERSGHLRFLDAFPADAPTLSETRRWDAFTIELQQHLKREFETVRAQFFASASPSEAQFAWLEQAANRDSEFERSLADGRAIRTYLGRMIPESPAEVENLPAPVVATPVLLTAADRAKQRLHQHEAALRDVFGYRLIDRNCVTELLATLDDAMDASVADRLDEKLDFVPFVSFASVIGAFGSAREFEVPSYRRTRLEAMYEEENDVGVWLRESNTLTSTIYRPNDRDSKFLFFTENAGPVRPVLGVLNLAAAAGEVAFGLLRAPFDRGHAVWSGLKGVVFSLPELFFIDLRKGVLDYAPSAAPHLVTRPAVRDGN